jgi:hypothetical protein
MVRYSVRGREVVLGGGRIYSDARSDGNDGKANKQDQKQLRKHEVERKKKEEGTKSWRLVS